MARKKRLTPKDKKIQTLEAQLLESNKQTEYWKNKAEIRENSLLQFKEEAEKKQTELRDQRGQVEGFLRTMTDSVRQLHDDVRAFGQPIPETRPRRNRNTGEWEDVKQPVPPTPERFIGYIEGSLKRIAIEGTHMQAPMIGVDMGKGDFTAYHLHKRY